MTAPITWDLSPQAALKRLGGRLWATATEVAAVLEQDPRTVRKAIRAGDIPSVMAGCQYRVPTWWIREQAGQDAGGGDSRNEGAVIRQ